MAISDNRKATIAFKNLLNKSNTDADSKGLNNEAEGIFFNVHSDTIFVDNIDNNPLISISNGTCIHIEATSLLDTSSNNHAFFAVWPAILPIENDPTTGNNYAYGNGILSNISANDRVINAIPPAYGSSYEIKPKTSDNQVISPGDASDWIYQYQSGIFYRQDTNQGIGDPATFSVYVYTGSYLTSTINNIGSVNKYNEVINGDDTTVDFIINHNLNTIDVNIGVYKYDTKSDIIVEKVRIDNNNVRISFSNPPNSTEKFIINIIG